MFNTLDDIKAAHTGHWFDKDTCRFFQSRFSKKVYPTPNGAYFISSERASGSGDYQPARYYSVRFCDANGDIRTVGEFQQHETSLQAHAAAKLMSIVDNAKPKPRVVDYDNPAELWVCSDCLHHHANGECGGCFDGHEGGEPLSLIDHTRSAMGLAQEFHSCGRENDSYFGECECETIDYSTMACDGCGSSCHGERHAMTEWPLLND